MNIRIAIIDDRQEDCNEIERLLLEWADSSYHDVTIKKFTDPIKVLNKTKADEFNYDLLFLDIKMPT